MDLREARDAFLRYIFARKRRSPTTVDTYRGIITQFIDMVGNKAVCGLTIENIDEYADSLALKNYAPKTYRCKLNAVRSFVRYLYVKDLTTIKPEQIDVPKDEMSEEANFMTVEEAQAFMSVITDVRDRAMMLFLLASWVRVSELINVRLEDVYKRSVVIRKGKGGKPRPVFISKEAEDALNDYISLKRGTNPGYLFPNPCGDSLSRVIVARKVRYYAEKAGIKKKVTTHTLRHTGATSYLDSGGRLEHAQKILGHEKIYTTMIYMHFKDEQLHKDYDSATKSLSFVKSA